MENKLEITEKAQKHIAAILDSGKSTFFRITVLGGGCSGFQYKFEFHNKRNSYRRPLRIFYSKCCRGNFYFNFRKI